MEGLIVRLVVIYPQAVEGLPRCLAVMRSNLGIDAHPTEAITDAVLDMRAGFQLAHLLKLFGRMIIHNGLD
jgi:hypothetical protein